MNPPLKKVFFLALAIALLLLGVWEGYWRSQGFPAAPEDNKGLWAITRSKVGDLDSSDVVILGSSRALYNFQLDVWEEVTGVRPLMLATAGKTPAPVLEDIVRNTGFDGTLVIGVAPGLFFSPTDESGGPYRNTKKWVDYFYERTYAQTLGDYLYIPVNQALAFINGVESPFFNVPHLKALINRIPHVPRTKERRPFPYFGYVDTDRNNRMWERMEWDTAYAMGVKHIWAAPDAQFNSPEEDIENLPCVLDFYATLFHIFQEKGGRVILVCNPTQGRLAEKQKHQFPREWFWDLLMQATHVASYHYEDHAFMNKHTLPEWSHMSAPQGREYTAELVLLMVQEGYLNTGK